MKKMLAVTLSLLLIVCCMTGLASATSTKTEHPYSAEDYAYMDLETAPNNMKEKILEARESIIFSQSWAADGVEMYLTDVETGEIIEQLPSFSSLFPGWDIPVMDTSKGIDPDLIIPQYVDMDCDPYIPGWDIIDSDTFVKSAVSNEEN